jgi:formylglycine-generating enzyme required for sulfatase activity
MAWIPPGPFLYGPGKQEVELAGYCIDLIEVTVGEINACIEAGGCDGFDTWDLCKVVDEEFSPNQCVPGRDDYPANYINWYRANAYCAWAGKRLPTSEEWEKSARGTDGRMFAWGEAPLTCELAHQGRSSVFDGCLDANDLPNRPVPNHLYPDGASPYGLLGTMGNLREWVEFREDETTSPEPGTLGLSRGAEYGLGEWAISVLAVDSLLAVELASQGHGVRCASNPLQ